MRKMSWIAAIALAGLSVVSVGAQKPDPDAQKIIDQYIAAFNKGDAKGVAALYTADATRVGPDGQLLTGRAAVEKSYADGFAGAIKGSTLSIQQGRVQVVTPDVRSWKAAAPRRAPQASRAATSTGPSGRAAPGSWRAL